MNENPTKNLCYQIIKNGLTKFSFYIIMTEMFIINNNQGG